MTKRLLLLSVAMMLLVVGCGGAKKATAPKEAILNMRDALADKDEEAFVSCFDVDENGEKMMRTMFEMGEVLEDFSEKVTKAFGEEAVGPLKIMDDPFAEFATIKADDLEITESEDGSGATCTFRGGDMEDMPLVKKDGVWLIGLAEDEAPTSDDVAAALKSAEIMTKLLQELGDRAEVDGMTFEKFLNEYDQKMLSAVYEEMAEHTLEIPEAGE